MVYGILNLPWLVIFTNADNFRDRLVKLYGGASSGKFFLFKIPRVNETQNYTREAERSTSEARLVAPRAMKVGRPATSPDSAASVAGA